MTLKEISIVAEVEFNRSGKRGSWRIDFSGVEVKDGGCLANPWGSGKTIIEAKKDYAKRLCGQKIVVNAMRANRREFQLPPQVTV